MANKYTNRRKVLQTLGAGALGTITLSSPIAAGGQDKRNNYGDGNGIGAFLNDEASWNDEPWGEGVTNMMHSSSVEVSVGAMETINVPENVPEMGGMAFEAPLAFAPQAVRISPGTEVTWKWVADFHHSVVSYNEDAEEPIDPETTGDHGQLFRKVGHEAGTTLTHTFDEPGTYLYFCHPHGTPYPSFDPFFEQVPNWDNPQENSLGMRGAVLVEGR